MTKHEYACKICEVIKQKSTCTRSQVGALLVNSDYEIISTGYNGAPKGMANCSEKGHLMRKGHCVRTVHAEINAIAQCAKAGKSCNASTMYVTYVPCEGCAKLMIQSGIYKVYAQQIRYLEGYELLKEAGIAVFDWEQNIFNIKAIKRT